MYTYDEWGNWVLHIQTGREGAKMLKEMGLIGKMSKEQYEKHMASYRQLQTERNEHLQKWLEDFIQWCKK
jgi:hypothetical protein